MEDVLQASNSKQSCALQCISMLFFSISTTCDYYQDCKYVRQTKSLFSENLFGIILPWIMFPARDTINEELYDQVSNKVSSLLWHTVWPEPELLRIRYLLISPHWNGQNTDHFHIQHKSNSNLRHLVVFYKRKQQSFINTSYLRSSKKKISYDWPYWKPVVYSASHKHCLCSYL